MKKFKGKKVKKNSGFFKYIFVFFFFFSYIFMISYCRKNRLKKNFLRKDVNYINIDTFKLMDKTTSKIIKNPVNLLNYNIRNITFKEIENEKKIVKTSNILTTNSSPLIYVYNTHQTEKYNNYSVYDASIYLKDKLNSCGLNTYLEERSIPVFLNENELKYYKSYVASRKYLTDAKTLYPSLTYFFDIHRDSLNKEKTTLSYNKKSYAKILFVIGLENKDYNYNLNNVTTLNNIINRRVKGLSKGIYKKEGPNVNGIYNQDFSPNVFLIEVGGKDNTKEEVENTMDIINDSILEYIRGVI